MESSSKVSLIPLYNRDGDVVGHARVDAEDEPRLSRHTWRLVNGYATFVRRVNGRVKHTRMHREVAGTPAGLFTDHIDGDRLNNTRSNLRVVTNSENLMNRGPQVNGSSRYKGVAYAKGGWQAYIGAGGRRHYLGRHQTELAAAKAYDAAARELHGEYARPNFPA